MLVASTLKKIKIKNWIDSWMSGKATARYRCAQHLECHLVLYLGRDTNSPTFTASTLGHPACCKPQRFPTGPKHLPSNSLSQHLNPALHNALNLTSTIPFSHHPREPDGELDWKTHQPWKGSWPTWTCRYPQQALGKGDIRTENDLFCQLTLF